MKIKRKITVGIIILIMLLTLGTSANAVEFKSRILNTGAINLKDGMGASATYTKRNSKYSNIY